MITISVNCYEVTCPDGAGMREIHVAYFKDKETATKFADSKKGWPHSVRKVDKLYLIAESVEDHMKVELETAKQKALAKLTREERILLCLEQPFT